MLCYMNAKFLTRPTGYLKVFQVILLLTCLGLLRHYLLSFGGNITDSGYHDRDIFGKVSLGGMVLATLPTLAANLFSEGHSLLTELLHALLGCVVLSVSGGFVLSTYAADSLSSGADEEVRKAGIAMGSLCVITALLYALDALFTFARWRLQ